MSLYLLQYISDEVMNEKFASSWGIPHLSQASYSWSRSNITNDPRKPRSISEEEGCMVWKWHWGGLKVYYLEAEHSYLSSTSKNSNCTTSSDKERYFKRKDEENINGAKERRCLRVKQVLLNKNVTFWKLLICLFLQTHFLDRVDFDFKQRGWDVVLL